MPTAIAHDYITQRGGAERVLLSIAKAFSSAPIHTTLFEPETTFPEFRSLDVRPSPLNRWSLLRRRHRLAFLLLAPTVSRMTIDADLVVVSSSGWAHGVRTRGRKIVYCHAPARWLYQTERYAGSGDGRGKRMLVRLAVLVAGAALKRWDRRAAASADVYLANSVAVQTAIAAAYGIHAEVLHPPVTVLPLEGDDEAVGGIHRPFMLCVARLLPYKNVEVVIDAVRAVGTVDLVIVGDGPEHEVVRRHRGDDPHTHLVGTVTDAQLRWLYRHCVGLIAASYEDFGLSPIEAAAFGKPTAALHAGGYLDTVDPEVSGVFFPAPQTDEVATAIKTLVERDWDADAIRRHAEQFSEARFIERLQEIAFPASNTPARKPCHER
jgi:glycosyltransferase involved in cell wall biosynthesis